MAGLRHWAVLFLMLGLTMLPAGSGLIRTEAAQKLELSQDPLPEPGRLHAERVRLYGIGLGDTKRVVFMATQARRLLIDDEPDVAFDVVYFYQDWIALRTDINQAAYRVRGGTVEAISLFGRLPRTTRPCLDSRPWLRTRCGNCCRPATTPWCGIGSLESQSGR